jgi:hypothetical protein
MILILLAPRYHFTGRFWDILRDLAEVGSFPESHTSPSPSSNKRVYESDEPVDSSSLDNRSKVSPSGRGRIAGSKRVSSSLGSANRGATSTANNARTSPPTITTTPGTQDSRDDLSIPSAAGSISTPENKTSSSSSPSTLTRIFDGDAIPITTNDLGRLPLHHGAKFPTNFDFEAITNGWDTSGSGEPSTSLGGVYPSPGLGQGEGANSKDARTGDVPGLRRPQEQRPEDLFPWIPYITMVGPGGPTTGPQAAPPYVTADPDPNRATVDQLDSTISSLFGDVPSTSSTTLGLTAGPIPRPVPNATEDDTDLLDALFPPSHPPVGTYPPPTVQATQQLHQGREEQEYGSLPENAQAYLCGWSNAPQAFE